MSILNSILGNTVGVAVSAYTGKPDQWTTANLIEEEAANNLKAQGIDPSAATDAQLADAQSQATSDITNTINSSNPKLKIDCTRTDLDILSQAYCAIQKIETAAIVILIVAVLVYLGGQYAKGKGSR